MKNFDEDESLQIGETHKSGEELFNTAINNIVKKSNCSRSLAIRILLSSIDSFEQIKCLNETVDKQSEMISNYDEHDQTEIKVTKEFYQVFKKFVKFNPNFVENIQSLDTEEKEKSNEIVTIPEFADMENLKWREITIIICYYDKLKIRIECRGIHTNFKRASEFGISNKTNRKDNTMLALIEDFDSNNNILPYKPDLQKIINSKKVEVESGHDYYKNLKDRYDYDELKAMSIYIKPHVKLKAHVNQFRGIIRKLFTVDDKLIIKDKYPITRWGKNGKEYDNYRLQCNLKIIKKPRKSENSHFIK